MTTIELIQLLRIYQGVGASEDWIATIPISDESGDPLVLDGISFQAVLTFGGTIVATVAGVVSGSAVTLSVLAASKTSWPICRLSLSMVATAEGYTKDVVVGSHIYSGYHAPMTVTALAGGALSVGSVARQVALNTEAIAALRGITPPIVLYSSPVTPLTGGWYLVATPGMTIQISDPLLNTGPLIIGDATGSATPNITIVGNINGSAGGTTITATGQSISLGAVAELSTWWMQ
jgi:hypothetical protein